MRKPSKTNWGKIKAMKDSDINLSDIPELDDDFFTEAKLWPGKKKQITPSWTSYRKAPSRKTRGESRNAFELLCLF